MTRVFHQVGFREKWNFDSFHNDSCGDGFILAPRYMAKNNIESLQASVRRRSIFDPQFFLPAVAKGQLGTYDFFPDVVSQGFSTQEYSDTLAERSAEGCLAFQKQNEFERCVIPSRLLDVDFQQFVDAQTRLLVAPFLRQVKPVGVDKPLLLQLLVTERMVKDSRYRSSLLNWVTGLDLVSGCYLVPYVNIRDKQVKDPDYLLGLLEFVQSLRMNNMEVVVGYMNTEAMVLLAAEPTVVATGSYENLRMFNPKAFAEDDGSQQRGPVPRLFVTRLLQWIDARYLGAIERAMGWSRASLDSSPYTPVMFSSSFKWHFSKPEIYKHYFSTFMPLLKQIAALPADQRTTSIIDRVRTAHEHFLQIARRGVELDQDSNGSHLGPWLTALNLFSQTS